MKQIMDGRGGFYWWFLPDVGKTCQSWLKYNSMIKHLEISNSKKEFLN